MSQNPSRRRGPHRAASPGHVPRLRGTRTELRGRWCVRWPGAAPRYRPAGESDTTPGTLRSAPAWTGAQGDGPGLGALAAGPAHFPPPAGTCPHSAGERAPRAGQRDPLSRSPLSPSPSVCPSLVPFFPTVRRSFLCPICVRRGPLGTCVRPGPDRIAGPDSSRSKFQGWDPESGLRPRNPHTGGGRDPSAG